MDILNSVHRILFTIDDPRIQDWIVFNSPYLVGLVLFAYIYFVFVCGPRFMKNRKPYSLKVFIKCYDLFQVVLNSLIVYKLIKGGWLTRVGMYCVPITYESSSENMEFLLAGWLAIISKMVDLLETVIFVLRKKDKQISFLHLYHHISTLLIGWIFGKNNISGMALFLPLINCSVHVIMYIYYFFSSFDGNIRTTINKYKHWVTIIQMVQFVILFAHNSQGLLPSCNVPKIPTFLVTLNNVINFFLFYNFYKSAYLKKNIKQN
ncbi:PREDICTED: elongation of very long chain fatty acids protein 1-like [Polistes canadensis]|uniref:elongation of very long chain fatty acids protein 1-like n=1 Tax=Polistes canadensis TaxID=91411 RepID=UPI000718B053|nr:PREDICTED: elongation of very long chain fatty acids protein 1-like [Polistes canadensis]